MSPMALAVAPATWPAKPAPHTPAPVSVCPACKKPFPHCRGEIDHAPYDLYVGDRPGGGCFTYLDLAEHCARFLLKAGLGPLFLFDRHAVLISQYDREDEQHV